MGLTGSGFEEWSSTESRCLCCPMGCIREAGVEALALGMYITAFHEIALISATKKQEQLAASSNRYRVMSQFRTPASV